MEKKNVNNVEDKENTEENENTQEVQKNTRDNGSKSNWDKIRKAFHELEGLKDRKELREMNYPLTIITVSCVVIAICSVFLVFNQMSFMNAMKYPGQNTGQWRVFYRV